MASGSTASGAAPGAGGTTAGVGGSPGSGSTSAGGTSAGGTAGSGSATATGGALSGTGASTGSGSTTGAGGTGSGGSGATSACGKPGVLFCEDFEAHTADAFPGAPWVLTVNGDKGTILVDATTAHSGTKSAKVSSLGNYQLFMSLTGAPVFASAQSALYVRTFLRLSEPMTSGHNTYFKAGAAGSSSSNNETRIGVMMEMLMINQPDGDRGFLSNQSYWTDQLPGAVIEKETWACVEGFFDPPNSTVSVAMNGEDIPDLHITDWEQDPLGALHFGFESYAGPQTILWYDDIVVSTQPIGCE